jgi:hypothetical protein
MKKVFLSLFILGACVAQGQIVSLQKAFGGAASDYFYSVASIPGSGYIMAGKTGSYGSGGSDAYVVRIDGMGNIMWGEAFGGATNEQINAVRVTAGGQYIMVGTTNSFGAGANDIIVSLMADPGNILWQKTVGGSADELGYDVQPTSDGGFIISGYTATFGAGGIDVYLVKLNSAGNVQWSRTYGGTGDEIGYSVQQTADGGYIVAGSTTSFGVGSGDFFVVRTDSLGNQLWAKTYGGSLADVAKSIKRTPAGGYIIGGHTYSFGSGGPDAYAVRIDDNGNTVWAETFGGTNYDFILSVDTTSDGGYMFAAHTISYGAGNYDFWLIKVTSSGTVQWSKTYGGTSIDMIGGGAAAYDNGYVLVGNTFSFGSGNFDGYFVKTLSTGYVCCNSSTPAIVYGAASAFTGTAADVVDTAASFVSTLSMSPVTASGDSLLCSCACTLDQVTDVIQNVSCSGSSDGSAYTAPTGGTPPYQYAWSPSGGTGATISNMPAGIYTVTVSDFNGCWDIDNVQITEPAVLTPTASVLNNVLCNGGSTGCANITVSGGTPPYTYVWWPPALTSDTACNLSAGCYTVNVTDANGCTAMDTVCITEPPPIMSCPPSPPNTLCYGDSGCVDVCVFGGTPPYSYLWTPIGATTETVCGLTAGNYTATVTDANGCTFVESVIITQPSQIIVALSVTDASCSSCSDGMIASSTTGGSGPYLYSWSPSVSTTATASNLSPGIYTCCVVDMNGCTACSVDTVSYPTSIENMNANDAIIIHPNPFTGELIVTCGKKEEAVITLYDYTGKEILRTKSNSAETVLNTEGLAAGLYLLRIKSGRGVENFKIEKAQ